MVGPSSRLLLFLITPPSLLHHRPSTLLRLARRHSLPPLSAVHHHHHLPPPRAKSIFPIKSSRRFHSQAAGSPLHESNFIPADTYSVPPSHPWPEWSELLGSLSNAGYFVGNSSIEDEFVANECLSMDFVAAASSCLCFARDRPDILGQLPKKDIQVLVGDGSPFLFKNTLEIERRMRSFLQAEEPNEATTVDLMKYVLSYASNPIIYPERNIKEAAESSARNLLREMASLTFGGSTSRMPASQQFQVTGQNDQAPRNFGPEVTMKRGDWICPKCSFMNFAKNTECLECEEPRPQRQLTGGEWDCPQCNFFNYRRNTVCLKCECKRPGEAPFPGSFGPSDRQPMSNFGDNRTPEGNGFTGSNKSPETPFNLNLDQTARRDTRPINPKGSDSGYTPFVPLPADMFAKKHENPTVNDNDEATRRSSEPPFSNASHPKSPVSASNESVKMQEDSQWSVTSGKDNTIEKEKPERWFQKIAELHEATDTNDDFPPIMPIRKGENRFVVGKKKDRSMTSPSYKRRQAMEQGNNSSFVPFVPFPPDYFAKKDDKQQAKNTDSTVKPADGTFSPENSNPNVVAHDTDLVVDRRKSNLPDDLGSRPLTAGSQTADDRKSNLSDNLGSWSLTTGSQSDNDRKSNLPDDLSSRPSTAGSQPANDRKSNLPDYLGSRPLTAGSQTVNVVPENQSGFAGKSLEGSAVKETDPLDMSEEAKAERWFRRVAQIKDISELSQIPDEDFPSIMPMRKGVNRFVVSKRKTPLERRLTSPQYRKNLRTMSAADPIKKEDDGNN